MRPAQALPRGLDLVGAERRAVRGGLAGVVGRAIADGGLAGDQYRLVGCRRFLKRSSDRFRIVTVDARGSPASGLEALHLVDRVGERKRAIDRNAVVVEKHD